MQERIEFAGLPHVGASVVRAAATLGRPDASVGLPNRMAVVESHRQDLARLAAYDRVCGFALRDHVPATWLHVLTFGLQTALMAERDFPFALAGLVHASNTMTLHRLVAATDVLRLQVQTANLRPHRRGATFEVRCEVFTDAGLAWSGTSTYLARGAKAPDVAAGPPAQPRDDSPLTPSQSWRLPSDLGRRYAGVSGDVNPIHLYRATARAFGFSRPIVHGMWTHARALAAFDGRLQTPHRIDVRFTAPIALPSVVGFAAQRRGEQHRFAVLGRDGGSRLEGLISPL